MTTTATLIIMTVLILFVLGVFLSRRQRATKLAAIEDLQKEKEAIAAVSLRDLAEEEARDLGLPEIEGADDVPLVVLLKVWRNAAHVREACPHERLRYVIREGVVPSEAAEPDVQLVCDGAESDFVG